MLTVQIRQYYGGFEKIIENIILLAVQLTTILILSLYI